MNKNSKRRLQQWQEACRKAGCFPASSSQPRSRRQPRYPRIKVRPDLIGTFHYDSNGHYVGPAVFRVVVNGGKRVGKIPARTPARPAATPVQKLIKIGPAKSGDDRLAA